MSKAKPPIGPQNCIRLACEECDCDSCDFVSEIPSGWQDVRRIQSLDESMQTEPDVFHVATFSVFDWFTHLGVCPECQRGGK